MVDLPDNFKLMLRDLMGDEASDLIQSLDSKPVVSIRYNIRKPLECFPSSLPVKWCETGRYLEERPEFILDPLLHAGVYYVQEASSMIYETVTKKILEHLNGKYDNNLIRQSNSLKVLDLCAAPGGKTTAIINALPDEAEVTANEYSTKRVNALKENAERWGFSNVKVTNEDSSFFVEKGEIFDIVAVDAPCSGEGMMRKEEMARKQWSPQLIENCSKLQKKLLENAVEILKSGGFLIYSTCTFNRKENEENAEYVVNSLGLIPVDMEFPKDWNIAEGYGTSLPVYRFLPHKIKGEGLFLAVFRKKGNWEPPLKSNRLNKKVDNTLYPLVDVDKETALKYLRGESIVLPINSPLGYVTISYLNFPLGPAKNIGKRANNHYPKNKRILKR